MSFFDRLGEEFHHTRYHKKLNLSDSCCMIQLQCREGKRRFLLLLRTNSQPSFKNRYLAEGL